LEKASSGESLGREEAREALLGIADGRLGEVETAALLTAIRVRGATVEEILGLREGVLSTSLRVELVAGPCIDIVGTGGDGKNTFNISTAACFVVAGAGGLVAKHGNFAATSVSGASNVLERLGVRFCSDGGRLNESLERSGVAYLHAPLFARAMKAAAPVRRALPFATVFNLLGPLVNPAQPECQLLGAASPALVRLYALVLQRTGGRFAIVSSVDGYDEVSLTSDFICASGQRERIFRPDELGLPLATAGELCAGATVDDAARTFLSVLAGEATEGQEAAVVANAAMALWVLSDGAEELADCVGRARESISSGRAMERFRLFQQINSRP